MYRVLSTLKQGIKTVPIIATASALAILAGCGGGGGGGHHAVTRTPPSNSNMLYYSYPRDNQDNVAPRAPVVLAFGGKVTASASNFRITDDDQHSVPFSLTTVDDGRGVMLTPNQPLAVKTHYRVTTSGIQTSGGVLSFPDGAIDFTTRPALKGAVEQRKASQTFQVSSVFPDDQRFQTADFSSFWLRTSQPIDTATAIYGSTVKLMQGKHLVPALLLAGRDKITVDPLDDMTPGEQYTLTIDGMKSVFGDTITAYTHTVMPLDTRSPQGERSVLVTQVTPASPDPDVGCLDPGVKTSKLTGMPLNCVPVKGVILADQTSSKQTGDVYGELAWAPNFPNVTPMRIKRGSILNGDPLNVVIGGKVPVGFDSGKVHMQVISDATGYLYPNDDSTAPDAPKHLVLYMDIASNTADPRANGAFTQNILHVKLEGIAKVNNGVLDADAVAVVEPTVLGLENSYGVLSFHMQSYPDQTKAPTPPVDSENPHLLTLNDDSGTHLSWQPGDYADRMVPGEPIVLFFNEALDPDSIKAGSDLLLKKNGVEAPFSWRLDGNALVITPDQPLAFGVSYQVSTTPQITDLAGNPLQTLNTLDGTNALTFSLPDYARQDSSDNSVVRGPWVMATYPGFPCATVAASATDIADGFQGACLSKFPQSEQEAPDRLPITDMPANRSIRVRFSQDMDPATIVLGDSCGSGSFRVEQVDANGNCTATVPGHLDIGARSLTFTPEQPWKDGTLYRYTLASQASGCGAGVLCSVDGLPLQTALLQGPGLQDGGPNMDILFRGAAATDAVFQELSNLPSVDVNNNMQVDDGEPRVPFGTPDPVVPANATQIFPRDSGGSGLVTTANTGCGFDGLPPYSADNRTECDAKKLLYLAGDLNTEIRPYDEQQKGVPVVVLPTEVTLTNLDSTAIIGLKLGASDGGGTLSAIPLLGPLLNGAVTTLGGVLDTLGLGESVIGTDDGLGLVPINTSTGPNIMRIRYNKDANGNRTLPPVGYIVPSPDGPKFRITLELLFDAPNLSLPLGLQHNVKSLPLPPLVLEGPVDFLPDGRMFIGLVNQEAIDVDLNISLAGVNSGTVKLTMPPGAINLSYQSATIKKGDLKVAY